VAILGTTGSGKSRLARQLFLTAAAPRLVIDPVDSDTTSVPGAVTVRDPSRLDPAAPTQRFVPRDPYDLDAYDAVYRWVGANYPRYVWCDEAGIAFPVRSTPRGAAVILTQGRKRSIGHLACHTRPRELDPNIVAQAEHLAVFALPVPDDRRRIAELAGLAPATLDQLVTSLPLYGFLWWDRRRQLLTVCDPLQV